ncbi:MAG: phosphoribosylaminoimidazolesuccinocarboxamide synthase [Candidatus Omnitrophota bacterium]|nr:MAG: phosphoribosylaminoimidazolesuccinocarboxamide synthase [Candidatus Omnitrophota bacterium]
MNQAITRIDIPGVSPTRSGKVRDIFDLGDTLLLVASDRISAYDSILPQGIPDKGAILTTMSTFWFDNLPAAKPHHVISTDVADFPEPFRSHPEILHGRSMLCKKAECQLVECVVRGYLAGSGWVEYQQNQMVCGNRLPAGLVESDELPEPIFTPATKSQEGHDINITFDEMVKIVGGWEADEMRGRSLELYRDAARLAREKGVIIADTKFEFGILDGEIVLIDEILTPDSSRFWSVEQYSPGKPQLAFDKQFVRDYLDQIKWDRNPPPPDLPDEIVEKSRLRYLDAFRMITGKELVSYS